MIEDDVKRWLSVGRQDECPEAQDLAFDDVFYIVDMARYTGDFAECEAMVEAVTRESVVTELSIDILLSVFRLTATVRNRIRGWSEATLRVSAELSRRGLDAEVLLWGLTTTSAPSQSEQP